MPGQGNKAKGGRPSGGEKEPVAGGFGGRGMPPRLSGQGVGAQVEDEGEQIVSWRTHEGLLGLMAISAKGATARHTAQTGLSRLAV